MKKIFLTLLAAASMASAASAQRIVEGIVTDSSSGNVLPFVNIAVSGTTVGTISDLNGEFHLNVPAGMEGKQLSFSSVGYSAVSKSLPVSLDERMAIALVPVDYKINEVVVTDKSQAGRRILKDVVENASANYINRDYSYVGDYVSTANVAGRSKAKATYHVLGYDSDGYTRSDGNNAFAALNYKFASVVRDFKVNDYESGKNHFDQVCGFDIVRYQFSVLNSYTLKDFDFTIQSETSTEYIVEFKCNKPRLVNTGAWLPEQYYGTITINKADNAIVSAKYTMELGDYSDLALSFKSESSSKHTTITVDVKYAKFSGKYAVKSIKAKTTTGGAEVFSDSFVVSTVEYKSPKKISGKVFYAR
ncbi:MAG: carboxypeptidase-like regulatory domain-containing protein [Bacteroidales bacterium]|nr:carboxypeptidase-like regulatory domain-containing protein [Bacteroidales bacterium]